MKIHGTAKGGALSKKDFGVAFSGGNGNGCVIGSWLTSGYSSCAPPVISTVTQANDTASPSGHDCSSPASWSSGTALSTDKTNSIQVKITGTSGEGGTVANTIFGLTTISSAAATDDTNMTLWSGGAGSVAHGIVNETDGIVSRIENANAETDNIYVSGAIFEIKITDTTLEFLKNNVVFRTGTVTAGTYYPFITGDNIAGQTGTFQQICTY